MANEIEKECSDDGKYIWKLECPCNPIKKENGEVIIYKDDENDRFIVYLEKETKELLAECSRCGRKHYITREK